MYLYFKTSELILCKSRLILSTNSYITLYKSYMIHGLRGDASHLIPHTLNLISVNNVIFSESYVTYYHRDARTFMP